MKTVVAVYTGRGLSEPLGRKFADKLPETRLINIVDEGLIEDINQKGHIDPSIRRRLVRYFENAQDMGANAILNTCSSVGEVADQVRPLFTIPIFRIDRRMAQEAVQRFGRVAVIATLASTLNPTRKLLQDEAKLFGRTLEVVEGLADGAYQALVAGKPEMHDALIREKAIAVAKQTDAIVLAQASMARIEEGLAAATGKPVLSSIDFALSELRQYL